MLKLTPKAANERLMDGNKRSSATGSGDRARLLQPGISKGQIPDCYVVVDRWREDQFSKWLVDDICVFVDPIRYTT